MTYRNFIDLTKRRASDKILCDKAFNIAKNPKNDGYNRDSALMLYTKQLKTKIFLIKNQQKNYTNQLSEKLIKEKLQPPFLDNIFDHISRN